MLVLVACCLAAVLIPGCLAIDLPSSLPRCNINDVEMGSCILNAANTLRSRIRKGINEIGLPSYDPLVISGFTAIQESSMMNYTLSTWNFTIRGMDNYDITEIRYDPTTMTFNGKIELNPLSINSIYAINGKLLFIPVRGNGTMQLAMGPVNGTFEIKGKMRKHKGVEFYDPTDVQVRLLFGDMSLYFSGLFDGNLEQAAMTNELVNRNSKMILDAGTPVLEKISETLIMRYIKWLTKKFPFYKLFARS